MTVDDAIKMLQSAKAAGVKNIIAALWDAAAFGRVDDEEWAHDALFVEDKMDWSYAHEDIQDLLAACEDDDA